MSIDKLKRFAAPCGLYCGACSIRTAFDRGDKRTLNIMVDVVTLSLGHDVEVEDLACGGCLSETLAAPCRECKIRDCAFAKGLNRCSECNDFPCDLIKNFNNDGFPHHAEALKNISRQREAGIDSWLIEQCETWRCTNCSAANDWYTIRCPICNAMQSNHF